MPKPNFTGMWKFNPAKSMLQIKAPDTTEFIIEHHEPALRITRTHFVGGKRDTFSIDLTTDGREVTIERDDLQVRCRAYWEDNALVFDSKLVRGDEAGTNVVRYTLSDDGEVFRAEEKFRSSAFNYDNFWLFNRDKDGEFVTTDRV